MTGIQTISVPIWCCCKGTSLLEMQEAQRKQQSMEIALFSFNIYEVSNNMICMRSDAFKVGRSFLNKGGNSFHRPCLAHQTGVHIGLMHQSFLHRSLLRQSHHFLHQKQTFRSPIDNFPNKFLQFLLEFIPLDQKSNIPPLSLIRIDISTRHDHPIRYFLLHKPGQSLRPPHPRHNPYLDLRQSKNRILRTDDNIRKQGDFEPPTQRVSLNHRNNRLPHPPDHMPNLLEIGNQSGNLLETISEMLDISPRREDHIDLTSQNDYLGLAIVVEGDKRGQQLSDQMVGNGVAVLGTAEPDRRSFSPLLEDDLDRWLTFGLSGIHGIVELQQTIHIYYRLCKLRIALALFEDEPQVLYFKCRLFLSIRSRKCENLSIGKFKTMSETSLSLSASCLMCYVVEIHEI